MFRRASQENVPVADIALSKHARTQIVGRLQAYFEAELDQEIEQFAAEFLLDFFSREVGAYFYNQG
ncbi:MAG: DUF2164 domain-containing protein, partial [Pseudomonadota bacterium]